MTPESGKSHRNASTHRAPSIQGRGKPVEEVREICLALELTYGSPRHGNKDDPLDELIYIILSTRTRDDSYRTIFDKLKARFPEWDLIRSSDAREVERILSPGGLGTLKTSIILDILAHLQGAFGRGTLDPLAEMSNGDAEAFLDSLPGVGPKIAKCVLMYSLGRDVLPVDVHVHRVATRLGLRTKKRPDTSQELIEEAIPPDLRYGFHVNAIAHGRSVCLPRVPLCRSCSIANWCDYYRTKRETNDRTRPD